MIQDIVKGDVNKKIVQEQDSLISEKNKQISFGDSTKNVYIEKYNLCEKTNEDWKHIDTLNKKTIESLKVKVKKEKRKKNLYKITTGVLLLIIGKNLISN